MSEFSCSYARASGVASTSSQYVPESTENAGIVTITNTIIQIRVSVKMGMGGGRGGGQSVGKREVVGREGEQRKKGRRGEGGNERWKKR